MRILACFVYSLFTIGYAWYPYDATMYTNLFNMFNFLLFIFALCLFNISDNASTEREKMFLWYAVGLSVARFGYTAYCTVMGKAWILYHTDVFNCLIAISFSVLLVSCLLKRS